MKISATILQSNLTISHLQGLLYSHGKRLVENCHTFEVRNSVFKFGISYKVKKQKVVRLKRDYGHTCEDTFHVEHNSGTINTHARSACVTRRLHATIKKWLSSSHYIAYHIVKIIFFFLGLRRNQLMNGSKNVLRDRNKRKSKIGLFTCLQPYCVL